MSAPFPPDRQAGQRRGLRASLARVGVAVGQAPDVDGVVAVAALVALVLNPVVGPRQGRLTPLAVLLAVLTAAPLVLRRRYPVAVLTLVAGGLLACLAVFHPNQAAAGVICVAVFTTGLTGRRARTLVVGASMAPVVVAGVAITSESPSAAELLAYPAAVLVALAAGDAVRSRRALALEVAQEARRESEAAAQHRFDQQRLQVANELHDTIAHALVAINIRASAAAHQRSGVGDEAWEVLDEIKRSSLDALTDLRTTLRMLRSAPDEAPMEPTQTLDDLAELVDRAQGAGISIGLTTSGLPRLVSSATSHAAYRIVQEALTNTLRHSTATHVDVAVVGSSGSVSVEIIDNGKSNGRPTTGGGDGLRGMAERAAALGGWCEAGRGPHGGWEVKASLPAGPQGT